VAQKSPTAVAALPLTASTDRSTHLLPIGFCLAIFSIWLSCESIDVRNERLYHFFSSQAIRKYCIVAGFSGQSQDNGA
jgi:hypothetical protein